MTDKSKDERLERGLEMVDKVYGPGFSKTMVGQVGEPYVDETINHLFGEIWSRPGLSMRDRRLLVIGATTMMGRADLIETQVTGAILNGELTDEELQEIPLQLAFYCGWGNTTSTLRGIYMAKKAAAEWNHDKD
jgi:alkylhydroperoxidase/carboxymuconolactone decarboxylase family protein YurZ